MRRDMSSRRRRSVPQSTSGQALVETALVLPIFLLLLFGLIDGGRFVYTDSLMSQAAREGARLAAVEAPWLTKTVAQDPSCVANTAGINPAVNPGAHVCPLTTTILLSEVTAAVNRMNAGVGTISQVYLSCDHVGSTPTGAWTSLTPTPTCTSHDKGDVVSVRVVFIYKPITPVAGQIIGSVSRSSFASMAIN